MKRKVKRYDGEDESEVKLDDSGSSKDYGIDYSESTNPGGSLEDFKYQPEPKSFKEAFAAGRAAALVGGPKTFTWNGKSYTTDLASSKPSSKSSSQPSSYAEMAKNIPAGTSDAAKQALMANMVKEKQKSDSDTKKASSESSRGSMVSKLYDSDILGSDLNIKNGDTLKKAREKAAQTRTEMPSGKKIREMLGSKYAKGGSVSSASKRADGIAMKGHTKGRIC
jgi:hypothetical protein